MAIGEEWVGGWLFQLIEEEGGGGGRVLRSREVGRVEWERRGF